MTTILLAGCVVACPLMMVVMMVSMRGGKSPRKRPPDQRSPTDDRDEAA